MTIRQQLDKHRADASCASCHRKIDPPGFALESFDVMGGWRERYRAVSDKVPPVKGFGMNGQAFAFHYALPVDSAGELPDGRPFKDVRELKKLLLQDEAPIARNLVRQLDGLRHRGAGAVLRPGRGREDPRRGEGRAGTACGASSTRSCRASCSGTSRSGPTMNHQPGPTFAAPFASTRRPLSRRRFLRGAGVALALPFLDAMRPPFARARPTARSPRRMFGICNNLGLLPGAVLPEGRRPRLHALAVPEVLKEHRDDFTVFSGVSHPDVDGGHPADIGFLTAAPHPASSAFRNTISLDQFIAERIGT